MWETAALVDVQSSKVVEARSDIGMVRQLPSADQFQLHIYAALAEKEKKFISERTKAALREAKARGVKLGGLRDRTMKRNKVLMAQAQERAEKLKGLVVPLRDQGATLRDIVAALNSAGILTPRGGNWHPTGVQRLLARL